MIKVVLFISIIVNIFFIVKYIKIKRNREYSEKLCIEKSLNEAASDMINSMDNNNIIKLINITNKLGELLKRYCKISYYTILREKDGILTVVNSNVEESVLDEVYMHCVELRDKAEGKPIIDTHCDYSLAKKRKIKSSYFKSIENIGAIYIENCSKDTFKEEMFETIIKSIETALNKSIKCEEISALVMKDNLTDIYNRNYMWEHMESLKEKNDNLLLAMMDIDYFKEVNDTYGHDFGDIVLKTVSNYVKNKLDENDEIYRYGGEEFVITFKNQDINEVENKLNGIKNGLSELDITDGKINIRKTVSFGVSKIDKQLSLHESLKKADEALYYSKNSGRNRITVNVS